MLVGHPTREQTGAVPAAVSLTPQAELERAFAAAPRTRFLPRGQVGHAGVDHPLEIGHGQTSSQPSTVRRMLELLDVRPGQRVLDVGAGSAWTTALLAHLVGPQGEVVGVELEPELAAWGATNLAGCALPWARVQTARPGELGWPDGAPYDRVLVSAEARRLPQRLVDQLSEGGVMVCPVAGTMLRVAVAADDVRVTEHGSYRFVPLREHL
jgi:protein-L-isoaspartate(D-aspartate) O-methyltransferase